MGRQSPTQSFRWGGGLFDVVEERDDRVFQRGFHLVHVCFCRHAAYMQSRGTMTCQHTGSGPSASFHSGRYLLCRYLPLPSPPAIPHCSLLLSSRLMSCCFQCPFSLSGIFTVALIIPGKPWLEEKHPGRCCRIQTHTCDPPLSSGTVSNSSTA